MERPGSRGQTVPSFADVPGLDKVMFGFAVSLVSTSIAAPGGAMFESTTVSGAAAAPPMPRPTRPRRGPADAGIGLSAVASDFTTRAQRAIDINDVIVESDLTPRDCSMLLNYCTTVPVHLNALQADRVAQLTSRNVPFEVEVSGLASKPRVVRG